MRNPPPVFKADAARESVDDDADTENWASAVAAAGAISSLLRLVEVERQSKAYLVRAAGPTLGQRQCPAIMHAVKQAFAEPHPGVKYAVLDLANVTTFSAMGVGLCTEFSRVARDERMAPVLFALRRGLMDQLRMFKIEQLYKVVRSQRDLNALLQ